MYLETAEKARRRKNTSNKLYDCKNATEQNQTKSNHTKEKKEAQQQQTSRTKMKKKNTEIRICYVSFAVVAVVIFCARGTCNDTHLFSSVCCCCCPPVFIS